MNHLHEKTKAFVESCSGVDGKEKKLNYVQASFWIPYTTATSIYNRMEEIFAHPRAHRMPDLLIIGRTNNGKSSLLDRFAFRHKAEIEESTGKLVAEVIAFVAPHRPTEANFVDDLLRALKIRPRASEHIRNKLDQVHHILEEVRTKVILIDEIQHLGASGFKEQRLIMNFMKNLSTIHSLSFIVAGAPEALNIFSADEQLANRFKPAVIPRWSNDDNFKKLLASFEALLPFEEPSLLQHPNISGFIITKTDGTIGDINELIKKASINAIKSGHRKLTLKHLETCGHLSPADIQDERKKNF